MYQSQVLKVAAEPTSEAANFFNARLKFETDPSEVYEDIKNGVENLVVVDARSAGAYRKSHVPGSINIPFNEVSAETEANLPEGTVVTYCWGPGCNGSAQAAAKLAELGRPVKEMMGGWEYWLRDDLPVEGSGNRQRSYAG